MLPQGIPLLDHHSAINAWLIQPSIEFQDASQLAMGSSPSPQTTTSNPSPSNPIPFLSPSPSSPSLSLLAIFFIGTQLRVTESPGTVVMFDIQLHDYHYDQLAYSYPRTVWCSDITEGQY